MGKLLCIAALMAAAVSATVTPSDFIPHRFQTGSVYAESKAREEKLMAANGLGAQNTTAVFFDQWIDHNDHSKGTFKQRYFVDYSYWDGNGPAALYISGESIAKGSPTGMVQLYGQATNSLLFTLEHRWYGDSALSTNYSDMSLMDTLTINNALADMVGFMDYVDANVAGKNLSWYSVGGSYAGGLSAWLKTVYPNRIKAAWSSSGVTNPQFDYWKYEAHVVSVLHPLCANTIKKAIEQVEAQWNDPTAFANIQAMFGVSNMSQGDFAYLLGDTYSGPVQYGQKAAMCDMLVPMGSDPLAQFVAMNTKMNGASFGERFMAHRNPKSLLTANNGVAATDMSGWLWNFQCCSQMAFWQIGYPSIGTKGVCLRPEIANTDMFMDVCAKDYGPQYFPDVYALHTQLGGAFPPATNVAAYQASDDPFAPAGVNSQVNSDYPFFLAQCDGCGHCSDLHAPASTDPASLVQARMHIIQYMNKWLGLASNVTFVGNVTLDAPTMQAAIVAAMPTQNWVSAMVYNCEGNKCYTTFTNATAANNAIQLARSGAIAGVTDAYVSRDSNKGDDDSGISRGAVIGIVIGCVMAFFITLAIIAIAIRYRQKRNTNGYHNVNADPLH